MADLKIIVSLNRYERKKNIELALRAFAKYAEKNQLEDSILVIAGGYDPRSQENV